MQSAQSAQSRVTAKHEWSDGDVGTHTVGAPVVGAGCDVVGSSVGSSGSAVGSSVGSGNSSVGSSVDSSGSSVGSSVDSSVGNSVACEQVPHDAGHSLAASPLSHRTSVLSDT